VYKKFPLKCEVRDEDDSQNTLLKKNWKNRERIGTLALQET